MFSTSELQLFTRINSLDLKNEWAAGSPHNQVPYINRKLNSLMNPWFSLFFRKTAISCFPTGFLNESAFKVKVWILGSSCSSSCTLWVEDFCILLLNYPHMQRIFGWGCKMIPLIIIITTTTKTKQYFWAITEKNRMIENCFNLSHYRWVWV